jgi:hypothetical protein
MQPEPIVPEHGPIEPRFFPTHPQARIPAAHVDAVLRLRSLYALRGPRDGGASRGRLDIADFGGTMVARRPTTDRHLL